MLSSLFSDFIPIIGTYAFAGYQFIYTNTLTISGFSVVLSSISAVRQSTMNIARNYERLTQTVFYFQNLRDFFDYKPEITDCGKNAEEFESIEFRNVSFGYPGTGKTIFKTISFRIEKDETTAVVGVNGAGKSDLDDFLYKMYDKIEDTESLLIAARAKKTAIEAEKLTADNIYKVLIYFDKLYAVMDEYERRKFMESLVSEVHVYEERKLNGQWLKSIKFKLPIIEENIEICLDNETHVECVVLLTHSN